ncbi:uncharacterized protein Dwil_GK10992 [Drosophila willistoni]|uniref:Endonuclease n=1 Tax=Drosophila willistoni TaxID=7260 RepID=B4N8P7_DROWI|nr:uncharacterized protein LOC6646879 [Drosophila willistoni]EDW81498.2 uncharacterized protein Dwil_GK10992 [Drosophila willistoni]
MCGCQTNLLLLLLFFFFVAHADADCQLTGDEISKTNRIFAFHTDSRNYYLQRLGVVPTGQSLDMICDANNVRQTTCKSGGRFEPSLPMSDCHKPIKASVQQIADPSCPYTMYRVGYKLNEQTFLEIYRSCYDVANVAVHFTLHLVYPNNMSGSGRPVQTFTTDNIISGAQASSFEAKNIFKRFKELLGAQQTYVTSERDLVFDRGHLAPSADFVFHQRQTFKYINVLAQFRTINRHNWKKIENWIRRELTLGHYDALKICTGGLGVLRLPDASGHKQSIYLDGAQRNPVPEWLFKIVSDGSNKRFVFLTLNNVHVREKPSPNAICEIVACPQTIHLEQSKEAGFTFCCVPTDFLNRNLPQLANLI